MKFGLAAAIKCTTFAVTGQVFPWDFGSAGAQE
jgi:hypothetical protein